MKNVTIQSDSVFINGIEYIPKDKQIKNEVSTEGLPYVMIRTYSAGVHFGYLQKKESTLAGMEVTLVQNQRMRYWEGAMDLTVLATDGSATPEKCKPSIIGTSITLIAIEILPITEKAALNLKSMPIWK